MLGLCTQLTWAAHLAQKDVPINSEQCLMPIAPEQKSESTMAHLGETRPNLRQDDLEVEPAVEPTVEPEEEPLRVRKTLETAENGQLLDTYTVGGQILSLVVDNTADWTAVTSSECVTCVGSSNPRYNKDLSQTATDPNYESVGKDYNENSVFGTGTRDDFCSGDQGCVRDFQFLEIKDQSSLEESVSGYLGLSRIEPFIGGNLRETSNYELGPPFLYMMEREGLIDERKFSLSLSSDPLEESFIDFGAPADQAMRDPESQAKIPMHDDLFWATTAQGVAFGSFADGFYFPDINADFINGGEAYAIFDTNSPYITVPQPLFDEIANLTTYHYRNSTVTDDGLIVAPCELDFPELYIMMNNYWFPLNLFRGDNVQEDGTGNCFSNALRAGEFPFIVLGTPIYLDLYAVHDDIDASISFAARAGSLLEGPQQASSPIRPFTDIEPIIRVEPEPEPEPEDTTRWLGRIINGINGIQNGGARIFAWIFFIILSPLWGIAWIFSLIFWAATGQLNQAVLQIDSLSLVENLITIDF